jgi:hypothetical protein
MSIQTILFNNSPPNPVFPSLFECEMHNCIAHIRGLMDNLEQLQPNAAIRGIVPTPW